MTDGAQSTGPTTVDSLLRRSVARAPDTLALTDAPNRPAIFSGEPVRLTWNEVDTAVDALVSQLAERGIAPGARVAVQLPNVVELPLTILACARMGAVVVPFPIQHRRHELSFGIEVAEVGLLVTGDRPDRPDAVATAADLAAERELDVAIFGGDPADERTIMPTAVGTPSRATGSAQPGPGDVMSICWTSGTTGTPKGVPRTNAMWLASARFQVDQLGLGPDDRILCPFPVVNMAGIGGMLVPWLMAGATLHLHQPLDLPVFLQQLGEERITYTVAPPPLLNMLLADGTMLDGVDLSHIRKIASGAAPLDPWMVEGWQQRGIEIVNVFGSNEGASLLSTAAMVPDAATRARAFPRPDRPGVTTRLVDLETGATIDEPGVVGELRFTGDTVFDGYVDSDGSEFDERGFYRTGDLFEWVDGDPPLLRFVDRAKDIIIRGGMNVSAAEVEGLVSSHESIVECAAVAYPDRDLGERVGVFVVAAPGAEPTLATIVEHLRSLEVASYKLPERLEVVDALPRNPVGKVTKPDLRTRWSKAAT